MVTIDSDFDELERLRLAHNPKSYDSPYASDEWYPARAILGIFDYFEDIVKDESLEVMQCTGLKDKKGIEIYEGDIVSWKINSIKCVGQVAWGEYGSWNKGIPGKQTQVLGSYQKSTEIIGNIYENPELLEKSK